MDEEDNEELLRGNATSSNKQKLNLSNISMAMDQTDKQENYITINSCQASLPTGHNIGNST
jgi:hypothetical protein